MRCGVRVQKPQHAASYNSRALPLSQNPMDAGLKQRLIGAAVLVALAVIFLPMLVKGPAPDSGVSDLSMRMPDAPEGGYRTVDLPLVVPADAPEGGVLGTPQPLEDGQLPTVDTATAHPVINDEPAQMRNIRSEIFAIDGNGADDLLSAHCDPDRILRAFEPVAKSREAFGHDGFETLAEAGCPGVIERMHLRDPGNDARPVSLQDLHGGCNGIGPVSQRIGVKTKSLEDRVGIRRCKLPQGAGDLPVREAVNGAHLFLSLTRKTQPLDAAVSFIRFFANIARQDELAQHAADTRFFKPQKFSQIPRRDVGACLDLDQGMHGGGRQIGACKVSPHEAEFADEPAGGGTDVVYGEWLLGHVQSIMVASCNHNHIPPDLPRLLPT